MKTFEYKGERDEAIDALMPTITNTLKELSKPISALFKIIKKDNVANMKFFAEYTGDTQLSNGINGI